MTTYDYAQLFLSLVGAVVLPFAFFLWRQARHLRENDLKHLDERLTRIEVHLDERLARMERELTEHLTWHLGPGGIRGRAE